MRAGGVVVEDLFNHKYRKTRNTCWGRKRRRVWVWLGAGRRKEVILNLDARGKAGGGNSIKYKQFCSTKRLEQKDKNE